MSTRAKFVCQSVTKTISSSYDSKEQKTVTRPVYSYKFNVVYGDSPENKEFFASTPGGSIELVTVRDEVFELNKSYYIDFTLAS